MKKISYVIVIMAVVTATAVLFYFPRSGPEPEIPEIVINPTSEELKKADAFYAMNTKITIPEATITQLLQPGQAVERLGNVTLEDKSGILMTAEIPVMVSKNETGDIVMVAETEIAVFKPPGSRWKVVAAYEGDVGLAYEAGRLGYPIKIAGDVFLTQRRIGAGVSKRFNYGYVGLGQSFDFKDDGWELVIYAGLRVGF